MRLLIVTNLFYPDRGGGASVFSDLCFGLASKGWKVTVFTTYPYYPEWRRKEGNSPWRIERETVQGVEVWRHGIYVPAYPSRLLPRIGYELSFAASLTRSLLRGERFDAVMVYCPMLGAVCFAALRKLLLREPLWLNVQDIPADAAAVSGISRSPLFNRLAQFAQRLLFNRADIWSTISPVMVERLAGMRMRSQPLHLCPNWLNGSLADNIDRLPSKLGRPPRQPLRLLYAGNIGKKQGLLEFCQFLAETKSDFRFQIHGDGGESETVRSWLRQKPDARFAFSGFLDEAGFAQALHETDVFVITEKSGSGASFIPSKLIPAIASATPILAVCDRTGPLGREMTEAQLGVIAEWNGLADTVFAKLSKSPETFAEFQRNCLDHSKQYRRNLGMARIESFLMRMVIGGKNDPSYLEKPGRNIHQTSAKPEG